jgi:enoyl-CoA hydratase
MTVSDSSDDRVLFEVDPEKRIATITLNNPGQRNSYDATMRDAIAKYLDRVADDDDLTVVLLRGADGVFSTGADMNNAYAWYGEQDAKEAKRRPSQRRRLTVDRKSFGFYHNLMGFPKVTVGEISGYALGGGFVMRRSACPPPDSSAPRWAACTCSSTGWGLCWRGACC